MNVSQINIQIERLEAQLAEAHGDNDWEDACSINVELERLENQKAELLKRENVRLMIYDGDKVIEILERRLTVEELKLLRNMFWFVNQPDYDD